MNCQDFVEQVTGFLEGAMSPEAERDFISHIAECDGCGDYLAQIRRTSQTLHGLPAAPLPGDTRDTLLNTFRDRRA